MGIKQRNKIFPPHKTRRSSIVLSDDEILNAKITGVLKKEDVVENVRKPLRKKRRMP